MRRISNLAVHHFSKARYSRLFRDNPSATLALNSIHWCSESLKSGAGERLVLPRIRRGAWQLRRALLRNGRLVGQWLKAAIARSRALLDCPTRPLSSSRCTFFCHISGHLSPRGIIQTASFISRRAVTSNNQLICVKPHLLSSLFGRLRSTVLIVQTRHDFRRRYTGGVEDLPRAGWSILTVVSYHPLHLLT